MLKLQEIEKALESINDAAFQDYCNTMFYWKNETFVTSTGSVIGKQKTRKGIPDSYIPIGENEFVFIEFTTKERIGNSKSLFKKLSGDVDGCFDEGKSGISNSQIVKVVLCFTDKLKPEEYDTLRNKCIQHGTQLEVYGLDQLAKAALRYPGLGKLIGIPVDTQQLLTPPDFINEYEHGKLATPLSNSILFREEMVETAINLIQNNDILVIAGSPGVGKSRLALEIIEKFCSQEPSFTPICVLNKGIPIHDDLRVHLDNDSSYLLFIDDANRASPQLSSILPLIHERKDVPLKIVATVRDYAAEDINNRCSNFNLAELKVKPLLDKEILAILESDDFGIKNRDFSDVIVRISQGNPRLAIMAAKVALEKNSLSAFEDIPKLYESYYSEVLNQIESLEDKHLLKILGLIAFFKTLGKEYKLLNEILSTFGISNEEFWQKVILLHELELVDLYENDIVKISDQILGMYFFYRVFMKDKILDLSVLLRHFSDQFFGRLKDLVYPIANTFGVDHVKDQIQHIIEGLLNDGSTDEVLFPKIYSLFWVFMPEKTLAYLWQLTSNIERTDLTYPLIFKKERDYLTWSDTRDPFFKIIGEMLSYPSQYFKEALQLSLEYTRRRIELLPEFYKLMTSNLVYDRTDHRSDYFRQRTLISILIDRVNEPNDKEFNSALFYAIINTFLGATFQKAESMDRDNSISIYTFGLPLSREIKNLRNSIWKFLFQEFDNKKSEVLSVFKKYVLDHDSFGERMSSNKGLVWSFDKAQLLPFLTEHLDPEIFDECRIIHEYLDELERMGVDYDSTVRAKFKNQIFNLFIVADQNLIRGSEKHSTTDVENEKGKARHQILEDAKMQELSEFTKDYTLEQYVQLAKDFQVLISQSEWNYSKSFAQILVNLVQQNSNLFLNLVNILFQEGLMPLYFTNSFSYYVTSNALVALRERHFEFYKIMVGSTPQRITWQLAFFNALEEQFVDDHYSTLLIETIQKIKAPFYFHNLEFLLKFRDSRSEISIYEIVFDILLKIIHSSDKKIYFGYNIVALFEDLLPIGKLQAVYVANILYDPHYDYDSSEIKLIAKRDHDFVVRLIEEHYDSNYASIHNELPVHNFGFVWNLDDYEPVMDQLMDFAKTKQLMLMDFEHFANKYFEDAKQSNRERSFEYLITYIAKRSSDKNAMKLLFNIVTYTFPSKVMEFMKLFLVRNQDVATFSEIRLYTTGVYSGSLIPRLEKRIELMKELDQLVESLPQSMLYIAHRAYIKNEIETVKSEIKWEQRREFEDFYS